MFNYSDADIGVYTPDYLKDFMNLFFSVILC